MVVFYFLLFVPIIMQHFAVKQPATRSSYVTYEKKNKNALAFFFLFLTVLVMLRSSRVGNDTKNYIYFFNNFARMEWSEVRHSLLEPGFSYFNKLVSLFTKNPQIFLSVAAILTIAMIYPTYKRLCRDASLTVLLFCTMSTFVMMFSGVRQMLAVGLGFVAYEFTRNKKIIPFFLVVCLALTVHTSAFMLAFMYPLYHVKIKTNWLSFVIPVISLVFVMNKSIFGFLNAIIARYTKYEGDITSTGAYTMLILFVAFGVFSFLIPDESKLDAETIGLRNFLLLSIVIQIFAPLHALAMRMNYYYIIFIPLLLPKIIQYRSQRWAQIAIISRHVMVVFFLVYFFVSASNGGGLRVFPYHFFWEAI